MAAAASIVVFPQPGADAEETAAVLVQSLARIDRLGSGLSEDVSDLKATYVSICLREYALSFVEKIDGSAKPSGVEQGGTV